MEPTLPTIHLNGTGTLERVEAFAEAWEIQAAEQRRIREGR
jgi:hypothetical protein